MKLLKKIDDNLLKGLIALFIFFIPLYPKFPFQIVNFTYIAIRFDDFLAVLIAFAFVVQLIRGKVAWKELKFKKEIFIFWAAVFAAFLSGLYLTKTIDYQFVGFLHAARRVEYMLVFFIAMAAVRTVKDFKFFVYALLSSLTMVVMYGLGQRLNGFPAISTMNPEFSKGHVLFLTPDARLSSTFAGHYDLGAYLVFYFPFILALVFYAKKFAMSVGEKIWLVLAGLAPIAMLMYSLGNAVYSGSTLGVTFTAAMEPRNIAIITTMIVSLLVSIVAYQKTRKPFLLLLITVAISIIVATASRTSSIAFVVSTIAFLIVMRKFWYVPFIVIIFTAFTYFDSDLIDRWAKTVQIRQILINEKTGEEVVVQNLRSDELPAGTAFVNKKRSNESTLSAKIKTDLAIKQASLSGGLVDTTGYETYSAVAADISIATRFQVSWPRAWNAFLRNPLLGTGPSSITESSDGDYFRWIGEMGALGTGAFLFAIGSIMKYLFDSRMRLSKEARILVWAVIFGTFGLFINAMLIDVFEASKVAYLFWLTLGLYVGLFNLDDKELKKL